MKSAIILPFLASVVFAASTGQKTCHVTGVDIEGPYYVPAAPKSKEMVCRKL